ncbi:Zinc finger, C2H2-like [Lasallia pustulata]|uniref:Zinc finger, C2H2-like n=1 Tax=Lasallia pustulata TaxID=136370 RepID=A0A1W5CZ28_9LECA|nr:Zinc finger, C2H2-like [Lasallia pustulata]
MEASVSSQGSYHAVHTSSPRSSATIEDNEDGVFIPQFSNVDRMHFASSTEAMDRQVDLASTLKPSRGCQRPPLTNLALWPRSEVATDYYVATGLSSVDGTFQRRSSGETEVATAREHELYQVGPQNDGLYHCPFEGEDGCTHKAVKLKCNYDKNLDSHLKPYRCKVHSCSAVPFSSTACLLRHEREAHGMHGHGEKPHQCWYEDCDRSIPGQGFPRRWNLYDHMKRVHNYTGPPSSNGSSSPTPSSASSHYQDVTTSSIKKRRTSSSPQAQAPKRSKPTSGSKAQVKTGKGSSSQGKQQQSMQKQWDEQHAALKERLARLDPNDTLGMEQVGADYAILHTISLNMRRLSAGQLANE